MSINNKNKLKENNKKYNLYTTHYSIANKILEDDTNTIPNLEKEIELLKLSLNDKISIDKKLDILDKIKQQKYNIKSLKKYKKDYYLQNSELIFEYFDSKKKISDGEMVNKKSLNNFFNISNNDDKEISKLNKNIDKYFNNIDNNNFNFENYCFDSDICKFCKKGELIPVDSEGIVICSNCSKSFKFLVENEKPCYKEPPKEVCFYAYKRINHLREILAQFQAKESTQIPEEVFINIKNQIKKERINIKNLTNNKAKDILKNLGYNKYYEHIPFIKDKLGIKPPVMAPDLEEKLCTLFMDIQAPYSKYCPKDRVNFLNYYYTLYKLCELLERREFLPYFPMLKDREKRIEQDEIWKKICNELNWKFIPTL
jgi:hypothetical protein